MGHYKKSGVLNEHTEAVKFFSWVRMMEYQYPELVDLHHIPNGGMRNAVVAAQLKAEGQRAGVVDYHLPYSRGGFIGLWFDLKALDGEPSQLQREFLERMDKAGHYTAFCYGSDQAIDLVERYITGKCKKKNTRAMRRG